MTPVNYVIAFSAGIVSFLSPCVIPLLPVYVSILSGWSAQTQRQELNALQFITNVVVFIAGFTLIFASLGATASLIGQWMNVNRVLLTRISAVIFIIMGLHLSGRLRLSFLMTEKRIHYRFNMINIGSSFILGIAFGFGWTPCVGPILASILVIAGSTQSIGYGMLLLVVYSLGIGLPFFILALLFSRFGLLSRWIARYSLPVQHVSGYILMITGILLFTGWLPRLSALLI